ncbi:MAG: phosphatase PAP2 family protein [Clostridia bacterium]|nr:phosphatase PAP2 family protein [Oscillospiraceae bacterium]MBR2447046.1 phosphatase PAP2 family protein [Clostridia bacterium]
MKKQGYIYLIVACVLLAAFIALTICLLFVDVRAAGESGAEVGFATINQKVWQAIGQSAAALTVSEVCGLCMIAAVGAFGVTGLVQVIRRKGFLRADKELYVMAGGLVLLAAAYVFFEVFVVNCRPVLDGGELAASYPSSHAMLATAVAGMGMAYLHSRQRKGVLINVLIGLLNGVSVATVACRLLGGVHWLSDIVGGVLLGMVIVYAYRAVCSLIARE